MNKSEEYVSRAGYKLAEALDTINLDFNNKVVLDVGSSTGGFTQVALKAGASKVYAIEKGVRQLHSSLRTDQRVVSMEQTDFTKAISLPEPVDIALVDVSFTSVRPILEVLPEYIKPEASLLIMLKPQFEAKQFYPEALNRGVIKNKTWRRKILKGFEAWIQDKFYIQTKVDSSLPGAKGNLEKFYLLSPLRGRG